MPLIAFLSHDGSSLPVALGLTVAILMLYTTYVALWRLYLSPVAHIPGPPLAILTYWNEFYYDVVCGGRYVWKIAEYHEKYGQPDLEHLH